MSPLTRGITRKGAPIQSGSCSTTAGAGAGTPAAATAFWTVRLGTQVVVRERGLQRRQPHDHSGPGRPEVDQHGLVGHASPGVLQGDDLRVAARRRVAVAARPPATRHQLGMGGHPAGQPFLQRRVVVPAPRATYGR